MACCPHCAQNSPVRGAPQFSQCVSCSAGNFDRRRRPKIPRRLDGSSATEATESAITMCSNSSLIGSTSFYRCPDAVDIVVIFQGLKKLAGVLALFIGQFGKTLGDVAELAG